MNTDVENMFGMPVAIRSCCTPYAPGIYSYIIMGRESLPPLLRGIGTTIILVATLVAFVVAQRDIRIHRAGRELVQARFLSQGQAAKDQGSLANEIQELREELEHENVAEEVIENRWFEWMSFVGTASIAGSFYVEWYFRRLKQRV